MKRTYKTVRFAFSFPNFLFFISSNSCKCFFFSPVFTRTLFFPASPNLPLFFFHLPHVQISIFDNGYPNIPFEYFYTNLKVPKARLESSLQNDPILCFYVFHGLQASANFAPKLILWRVPRSL